MSAIYVETDDVPDGYVRVYLVPVTFSAGFEVDDPRWPDEGIGVNLSDAVQSWSDCNRAFGHTYRIEDMGVDYREPGDVVGVLVRKEDLTFFERDFEYE